ncbi:hypothetical protein ACERK3_13600 [Phycisphaerales bacterium AB-hyl4]|uniref:Uncharacterized protein n=1 Tax=Natronomicrosphaera hydrolytica TaxID=3242702 RepID=A0ABV4U9C7_9BACT
MIGKRMEENRERQAALEQSLSELEMAELDSKYYDDIMAADISFSGQMRRLGPHPEIMQYIESVEGIFP